MKVKLIEVLNMIEDKTLKDNERVIIDNELFYFNQKEKKFYTVPSGEYQNTYKNIFTNKLDLDCELIDRYTIEKENLVQSKKEIKELVWIEEGEETGIVRVPTNDELRIKINELVREINMIKNNL